ncbi:acyltransferase family protein [Listeria booriae]|uniref:Acyltransferase family protein n=1 Tax=Listeria booriae TaxID=1552123 RepID=A0A7X1CCT6_9LIST|nr:acyltransferase family protein [Listeria booriae]MBC1492694.1 acyltransferase family protein [Listeria booriae]MBC1502480.1 acyltransferase family protein [Listeria booriae]MBC1523509.1 acyltransferase family protein [Listeria booriae]MBC1529712.1 acyltransferase family protein [Listeria booriae]MBC6133565.1 acyltransferase family protein [Listeria booriae]
MERKDNLDLLRCMSILMVIVIHVSASYLIANEPKMNTNFDIANFYDSISRTAVPLFVLLSGYFTLRKSKNLAMYFKKITLGLIVPTIIWMVLYEFFEFIDHGGWDAFVAFVGDGGLWGAFNNLFFHDLGRHLWFMPMFIGLQILAPLLIAVRNKIGEWGFLLLGIFFLAFGILEAILSFSGTDMIVANIFNSFVYLGYFILGYSLPNTIFSRLKKVIWLSLFVVSSVTIYLCTGWAIGNRTTISFEPLYFYDYLSIFVIIAAISLFMLFTKIKIRNRALQNVSRLITPHIFFIYFVHLIVLRYVTKFFAEMIPVENHLTWAIPVMSIIIFIISYLIAVIFGGIKGLFVRKKSSGFKMPESPIGGI